MLNTPHMIRTFLLWGRRH